MQGDLAVAEVTQVAEETEDIRGLTDNVENIILRNGSALEIDDWVLILYNEVKYPGKVLSVVDGGDSGSEMPSQNEQDGTWILLEVANATRYKLL